VFEEQCEVVPDEACPVRVKAPEEIPCDNVLNPADPDASYNTHKGVGYTVQIMETFSDPKEDSDAAAGPAKPDLITHVSVGKMTTHDQDALVPALIDTTERKIEPHKVLADSHYGSNECLKKGRALNVEIVSPSMPAKGKQQGKLILEDFELDEQGCVVRCPEGKTPIETHAASIRLQVLFATNDCANCPQRDRCPVSSVGRKKGRYPSPAARTPPRLLVPRSRPSQGEGERIYRRTIVFGLSPSIGFPITHGVLLVPSSGG
jgi:hypothetical protein